MKNISKIFNYLCKNFFPKSSKSYAKDEATLQMIFKIICHISALISQPALVSGLVDRASATETVDWSSILTGISRTIPNRFKPFLLKIGFQLPCLTFSIMKPPPCVVDRWAGGSLTRRPKRPFVVSWLRQLGE